MPSVLQPWVMDLSLREQGTILAGIRGCDSVPKNPHDSAPRQLSAYLRWVTMVPADEREVDYPGAFMQNDPPKNWRASELGHLPEHYYSHLMHAYEVVGYRNPNEDVSWRCRFIYQKLVSNLHLNTESREQMIERMTEDRIATGQVTS